jgi:DNA-directed RNA polymerase subunit RPC12/RpoP
MGMNKDNCKDRSGKSHFGEYGWYDGYHGTIGNCRCGLKARAGACEEVDNCIDQAHKNITEGGEKTNIVSYNINNMVAGEKDRDKEQREDEEIATTQREKQKEQAEKDKVISEAKAEGKIICAGCSEKINPKEQKEVKQGIIECPKCNKKINAQTGDVIVGEDVPEKKEEPKDEKKDNQNLDEEKETELIEKKVYDHKCLHCGEVIGEKGTKDAGDGKIRHGQCGGVIKLKELPKEELVKKEASVEDIKKEEPKEAPKSEEKKEDKTEEKPITDKPENKPKAEDKK